MLDGIKSLVRWVASTVGGGKNAPAGAGSVRGGVTQKVAPTIASRMEKA